jgi:hypothetical protein
VANGALGLKQVFTCRSIPIAFRRDGRRRHPSHGQTQGKPTDPMHTLYNLLLTQARIRILPYRKPAAPLGVAA